jgi:hypothetical protein
MATVCGGSLALFDAGVPMLSAGRRGRHGPGQGRRRLAVLTDIAGQEDHYGDMDFKVAGTRTASPPCRWTSRSPASPARSCRRRSSRRRPAGSTSSRSWRSRLPAAAPGDLGLRAAPVHHPRSPRQDPRRHRTRRQDDPRAPEGDRLRDRGRDDGSSHRRLGRRRRAEKCHRHDRAPHRSARDRQGVRGHRAPGRGLRRLRRDPPRPRRPRPHLGARPLPRARDLPTS